jgi:hypothetical protein
MAQPVRAWQAMIVLETLMVLGLVWVLVCCVLLIVVQQVWNPSTRPIKPGIVSLLVILRVHACHVSRLGRSQVGNGIRSRANARRYASSKIGGRLVG